MRTECITDTNFRGTLIITNHLTNKPGKCIDKVKGDIENLIIKKDYNLYITQDYSANVINIKTGYPLSRQSSQTSKLSGITEEKLPVNAKSSRYYDAAKKVINDFEAESEKQKEKQWEKECNKQEWEEIFYLLKGFALLPILIVIGFCTESMHDAGKSFKQIVNKAKNFAIKKG